jgi:hypothetical protein
VAASEVDLRPERPRVFCIGLNKTGTSSFHRAMTILGLQSLHWGGPAVREAVEAALVEGRPLLSGLDQRFDAFADILPIAQHYALLDEQYPGSRFVLTVRPVEDWIDSRRRHVENNIRRKAVGEYDGTFLEVDEPAWRREWETHVRQVRAHFGDRTDFLEVDITSGAGWRPFCDLLGVPVPADPFPWQNRYRAFEPGRSDPAPAQITEGDPAPRSGA